MGLENQVPMGLSLEKKVIGFIGGGNMAKAIVEGILKKELVTSSQIIVSSPSESTLENWKKLQINAVHSNSEVIRKADIIFLSFKPHQLEPVFTGLDCDLFQSVQSKLFVSILAGITSQTIFYKVAKCVGQESRVVRVMPNTPAMVCEGCSAIVAHSSATENDVKIVEKIFLAIGKAEVIQENLISAVTGLAGSGPAFIYTVIEALSDGAVKQGLPRSLATKFAAQTLLGSARMVLETQRHPAQLKDEVCSAGGTTIHGLHALEKGGLRAALMNAVEAAAKRGEEISRLMKD